MPPAIRQLFVLRHAKSSRGRPGLPDRERSLNKRGRRACSLVADHLERNGIAPAAVVCSPARRTVETLARISHGLPRGTATWTEERLYASDADGYLEVLREFPEEFRSAMLIGHNPAAAALVALLAAEGDDLPALRAKYPTGALATLTFAGSWTDLRRGGAALDAFVRPRDLQEGQGPAEAASQ